MNNSRLLGNNTILLNRNMTLNNTIPPGRCNNSTLNIRPLTRPTSLIITRLRRLRVRPTTRVLVVTTTMLFVANRNVRVVVNDRVSHLSIRLLTTYVNRSRIGNGTIILRRRVKVRPTKFFYRTNLLLQEKGVPTTNLLIMNSNRLKGDDLRLNVAKKNINNLYHDKDDKRHKHDHHYDRTTTRRNHDTWANHGAPRRAKESRGSILLSVFRKKFLISMCHDPTRGRRG